MGDKIAGIFKSALAPYKKKIKRILIISASVVIGFMMAFAMILGQDQEANASTNGYNDMSGVYGNTAQEKVWYTLRAAGYSEYAVAGVMGNISQESSWNELDINSSSGATGLCQWTAGRCSNLKNYASSKGTEWSDIDTQIEFLLGELSTTGGADRICRMARKWA